MSRTAMLKRYIVVHETEGFICGIYAERFERVSDHPPNSKSFAIIHVTEETIAVVYAERYEVVDGSRANSFNGNRSGSLYAGSTIIATVDNPRCRVEEVVSINELQRGSFWIGSDLIATLNNSRCSVQISGVLDISRPAEDHGKCLSLKVARELEQENQILLDA